MLIIRVLKLTCMKSAVVGSFQSSQRAGGHIHSTEYGYEVLVKLYLLEQIDKRIKL